ncbi:hypothetical protein VNI00_015786 [Paramarasmius palmivorus]|uniref:Peptidase M12A domain-containing protein n=1 Tax=Paramarasmius palmivorus TaxID=297713 RepID=A0AAW0BL23_9AGAR
MKGSTKNQEKAVKKTIQTWSKYANVRFQFEGEMKNSNIRIGFEKKGWWSAIGIDADSHFKDCASMNLELPDDETLSAEYAGLILHEFGHALGMLHEHQSPARGQCIHLKELEVYNYYRPLLNFKDTLVKSQVIDVYNDRDVSNFSNFDMHSIMMYAMPARLNKEGIDIPMNVNLSEMDKAFIMLNYPCRDEVRGPRDEENKDKEFTIYKALEVAGIPEKSPTAKKILDSVCPKQPDHKAAREEFIKYNRTVHDLHQLNKSFLASVDISAGHGIASQLYNLLNNDLVRAILRNIISKALADRGMMTDKRIPDTEESDLMSCIGALVRSPEFADVLWAIGKEFLPESSFKDKK